MLKGKSHDHLFRRKYSELLSALLKSLGPRHFQLAGEAIQTAYQEAAHRWPISGSPSLAAEVDVKGYVCGISRAEAGCFRGTPIKAQQ